MSDNHLTSVAERPKQTARKAVFGRAPWTGVMGRTARRTPPPTAYEKMGFPNHDVLKERFDCDGPRKLSDPLTLEQEKYLEICVDSAFKTPYRASSWADPYFPGMDNLKEWFQHHKDIKTARTKHSHFLKELAVYESVEDAENDLHHLIGQRPKRGNGLFGQPTTEDFQAMADELMAEQESHENTLKQIELHKQEFVEFVEAEKIDDHFKEILDLRQRNSEITELIENLLANEDSEQVSTTNDFDERIRLTIASDKVKNCEIGVQTDEIGTGVENSVKLEQGASSSGYGTESGVRVKTENF